MARSARGSPGGAPKLHRADRRRVGCEAEDGLSPSPGNGVSFPFARRSGLRRSGDCWPEWTSCARIAVRAG